jgi:endoglucanase
MAICARVYKSFRQHADLASTCQQAAIAAWQWAMNNPSIAYIQPEDIQTGMYAMPEDDFVDEFIWAASELFITTGDDTYLKTVREKPNRNGVPSWEDAAPLAWMSLSDNKPFVPKDIYQRATKNIVDIADFLLEEMQHSAYAIPMGIAAPNNQTTKLYSFTWGSNSLAANQSVILLQAYRLTQKREYLDAAQANFDYLLGRNATGYSFVTAFGYRPPMRPHHRPSVSDKIKAPIPGLLVGGPHSGHEDLEHCEEYSDDNYPSDFSAVNYLDHDCSFATNEVAINWNAALVFVSGHLATAYQ